MRRGARAVGQAVPTPIEGLRIEPAAVVAVTPGAASDGRARVEVSWNGTVIAVSYPDGLVLATTDVVQLAIGPGGPPFVLCRQVGAP